MNGIRTAYAFTLIELLIIVGLISVLASFFAFQSIGTFQLSIEHLRITEEALKNEAGLGKKYRHIINNLRTL